MRSIRKNDVLFLAVGLLLAWRFLRALLPRGLRIGRVESPLPGDQLYTSAARIAPAVDYEGMREVYVVVGFSQ